MTENTAEVVKYWIEQAHEAMASARDEEAAGRLSFAINRCYYAASAVLLSRGQRFVKHTGVRAAVHRELVKPGLLQSEMGRFYDKLFEDRQEVDYIAFAHFLVEEVREMVKRTAELVQAIESLAVM